jgi:hypothetical protein
MITGPELNNSSTKMIMITITTTIVSPNIMAYDMTRKKAF